MKRVFCGFLVAVLFWSCVHIPKDYQEYSRGEAVELSDAFGNTLDGAACRKFNLLQEYSDLETVRFYEIHGGGLEIEIETGNGNFIAAIRDEKMADILRDYFERYDDIQRKKKLFETKWNIVAYDDLGFPITMHELRKIHGGDPGCGISMGCGLLIAIPAILVGGIIAMIGNSISSNDGEGKSLGAGITIALIGVGSVLGYAIGARIQGNKAIDLINETRKPREVNKLQGGRT